MSLQATTSQTVGPYLHIGLNWLITSDLASELGGAADTGAEAGAGRVTIAGRVTDGNGRVVNDALLEIWQANGQGKYADPMRAAAPGFKGFLGFGRCPTDDDGGFQFTTIKPGAVAGPSGQLQAPHIVVNVFARGLLKQLVTRIYFPGERSNETDPVLQLVPAARRATLIARPGTRSGALEWNVVLRGDNETVFFDC